MKTLRAALSAAALILGLACERRAVEVEQASQPDRTSAEAPPPEAPIFPRSLEREGGLVVEVLEAGSGPVARLGGEVLVHYTARLAQAEQPFDSSWSRGVPARWTLSTSARPRLIEGLVRGLEGLPQGSRAVVRIPSALAWGTTGSPAAGIPPDADLVYEVRILEVR